VKEKPVADIIIFPRGDTQPQPEFDAPDTDIYLERAQSREIQSLVLVAVTGHGNPSRSEHHLIISLRGVLRKIPFIKPMAPTLAKVRLSAFERSTDIDMADGLCQLVTRSGHGSVVSV
jgi:hypothetical protein